MPGTWDLRKLVVVVAIGSFLLPGLASAQVPPDAGDDPDELVCCPGVDASEPELGCEVKTRAGCSDVVEVPLSAGFCCPLPIVAEACTGNSCVSDLPGVCAPGTYECQEDGTIACVPLAQPSAEVCDGNDNDCNGQTDEGLGSTTCGTGECEVTVQNCVGGQTQTCTPDTPSPETCDGLDNDCDGSADDGNPGGGAACSTGEPGVCAAGTTDCQGGALACVQNVQPSPETCDGLDNDCDGAADDGNPGGGQSCSTGQPGVCGAGTTSCTSGAIVCTQNQQPSAEVCGDGLDNDCDGAVDESCSFRSCREILDANPGSPSGTYTIDPDGNGPRAPIDAYCDMNSFGGGWTNLDFATGRVLLANGHFVQCRNGLSQTASEIRCQYPVFAGDAGKPLYHYRCDGTDHSADYILDHMAPLLGHRGSATLGFGQLAQRYDGSAPPSTNDQEFCYVNGEVVHYANPLCEPYSSAGNGNCTPSFFTLAQ